MKITRAYSRPLTPEDMQTPKRMRVTMACERCRSKKVKCDFTHPVCSRCAQSNSECSYDGTATQLDYHLFVNINNRVDMLEDRMDKVEGRVDELEEHNAASTIKREDTSSSVNDETNKEGHEQTQQASSSPLACATRRSSQYSDVLDEHTKWSVSFTPKGVRIETNIISIDKLYEMVFSGITRIEVPPGDHGSPTTPKLMPCDVPVLLRTRQRRFHARLMNFPLYSSWEVMDQDKPHLRHEMLDAIPLGIQDKMMQIWLDCFPCLQVPEKAKWFRQYKEKQLSPVLINAIFAWSARHSCIYHGLFQGMDPNVVGEIFFQAARDQLSGMLFRSSPTTIHILQILSIYQHGRTGTKQEKEDALSESYLWIGTALRMCLDLGLHKEQENGTPAEQEYLRRLFWNSWFLEVHTWTVSDKAVCSAPTKEDIEVRCIQPLDIEDEDSQWAVEFIQFRHKMLSISYEAKKCSRSQNPLMADVSNVHQKLKEWYNSLPADLQYEPFSNSRDFIGSKRYRDQVCIKLCAEYHFNMLHLYRDFIPEHGQPPKSTTEVLAKEICAKAAASITELGQFYCRLDQPWCHFSLDVPIIAATMHQHLYLENDPDYAPQAEHNLRLLHWSLVNSPVRRHKAVNDFVKELEDFMYQHGIVYEARDPSDIRGPVSASTQSPKSSDLDDYCSELTAAVSDCKGEISEITPSSSYDMYVSTSPTTIGTSLPAVVHSFDPSNLCLQPDFRHLPSDDLFAFDTEASPTPSVLMSRMNDPHLAAPMTAYSFPEPGGSHWSFM
ncbi:hypothetical protein BZG36_04515 [Bifiguratus adelaidae]|uniref:Zn(2)-C6 fungal-type domain-containing protein n=1 Tax=Bifiguratus adelaidae TaxID=1938954 RepID=A0A261XX68_9FUNG|nr:hypothetical protein BZG36_04515 [Bifiguratus adelaidae]